jgi:DNA primase
MSLHEFRRDAIKRTVTIWEALELVHVALPEGNQTQQVSCPFHTDRHPSARVYEDHLFCFTCGKSWDAIDLVQQTYGLTYLAAVEWLESEFQVIPADMDPTALIRATLRAKAPISLAAFVAYVEQQLVSARPRLTLSQYARLTTAMDVVSWQLDTKVLTPEAATRALQGVLGRVS